MKKILTELEDKLIFNDEEYFKYIKKLSLEEIDNLRKNRINKIKQLKSKLKRVNNQTTKEIKTLEEKIKVLKNDPESIEEVKHYKASPLWPNGLSQIFYKIDVLEKIKKIEDRIELLDFRRIENIESIIEFLYEKYVCSIFGHEYYRKNGEIEYDIEDLVYTKYTDRVYEDEKKLISYGSPGTIFTYCKYCGEKIYGNKNFPLDYKDKISIGIINKPKQKKKNQ